MHQFAGDAPRPSAVPPYLFRAAPCGTQRSKKFATADARRCTRMGRVPQVRSQPEILQPNVSTRADAMSTIPFARICGCRFLACFPACRTLPQGSPGTTRRPKPHAPIRRLTVRLSWEETRRWRDAAAAAQLRCPAAAAIRAGWQHPMPSGGALGDDCGCGRYRRQTPGVTHPRQPAPHVDSGGRRFSDSAAYRNATCHRWPIGPPWSNRYRPARRDSPPAEFSSRWSQAGR